MFNYAGYNATIFSITIPRTNGNGINNDTTHMYGSTSSTYADPQVAGHLLLLLHDFVISIAILIKIWYIITTKGDSLIN